MRVLVTGGAGYIGSVVGERLVAEGYEVVVFDNLSTGWREAVRFGPLEEGDLMDRARLDEVMKPDAVLATNTSTLDIDQIAGATKRPESVIGTHFFSPANVMKLLEIVRGKQTGKDVLASALALSK